MSRPIRFFEPERLYFITSRCHQSQFLLRPDAETTEIVGAVVARGLYLYRVKLYGFVAMSNHVHAIVQGSPEQIASWARYIFGQIARRVNKVRGRRGAFWGRRYSAEPILDDAAAWDRLVYLLANPVQSDLVAQSKAWPGFSTLHEAQGGSPRSFRWLDAEGLRRTKRSAPCGAEERFTKHHPLTVSTLPDAAHWTAERYTKRLKALLTAREQQAAKRRRQSGRRVAPMTGLLTVPATDAPRHSKRSHRPLCHASSVQLKRAYKALYHAFREAFHAAVEALRRGQLRVRFPRLAFRPSLPPLRWGTVP